MIGPGEDRPVRVDIAMSDSAGIFQVDELLADKLRGSDLEDYSEVTAHIDAETEPRPLEVFKIQDRVGRGPITSRRASRPRRCGPSRRRSGRACACPATTAGSRR
jgi:hypothetical protein